MRILVSVAFSCVLALAPLSMGAASAEPDEAALRVAASELLGWMAGETRFDIRALEAEIRIDAIPQEALDRHGELAAAQSDLTVGAAFDRVSETVLVPVAFDPRDVYDRSLLLHELVHFAQHRSGVSDIVAMEREAYALQARFLRAHGLDVEAVLTQIQGMYLTTPQR